jgi:hypothetical protein
MNDRCAARQQMIDDDHRRARTSAFVFRPQELTEAEGIEEAGREQT